MKEYRLADIIDIKHGYAFDGEYISANDNGIVLVTPGNFKIGGGFQEDKCKFFCGEVPKEYILKPGAFIVTMTDLSKGIDTLGYSAIIPKHHNRLYLHNQRIGLVTFISKECDKGYIYYLMQTRTYQRSIANSSTGSTVHHTSPTKIKEYCFIAPELSQQRKIAEILYSYDSLIENNQKQIKLLEEAAQRLYKEWFVDLRFPGFETTPVTDGVPEGWQWSQLSDIATVNKQSISKEYPFEYVDYIDISSVSSGRIESKTRYTLQEAPGRAKRITCDGDVIWGMVRPNLKSYALMLHPTATTVVSTGFAVLSTEKVPFSFLYCHVTQDEFVGYLVNCTNGAAYPAVKPIHFEKASVLVPKSEILEMFHFLIEPMFRKIESLSKQIDVAIEARNRLLPKLMSGEMEVRHNI